MMEGVGLDSACCFNVGGAHSVHRVQEFCNRAALTVPLLLPLLYRPSVHFVFHVFSI